MSLEESAEPLLRKRKIILKPKNKMVSLIEMLPTRWI